MRPFPPRPCTSGIHAGQSRHGCDREEFRLCACHPSVLAPCSATPVAIGISTTHFRQFSLEGGAGERVQGARAAYGTCFVCADRPGPPVIPAFLRLPTPYLIRHIQGVFGNKIPP